MLLMAIKIYIISVSSVLSHLKVPYMYRAILVAKDIHVTGILCCISNTFLSTLISFYFADLDQSKRAMLDTNY